MQYLFVITYGRSGSTVLMNLLNSIEGYVIRGENNGMFNHLALAAARLKLAQDEFADQSKEASQPWFGTMDIDASRVSSSLAEFLVQELLRADETTRVTGFKEIRFTPDDLSDQEYDQVIEFLQHEFPNAKFIFNTRSWRDVARSGWWRYSANLGNVRRSIERSDARFHNSASELGERAYLIDYAQTNGKPEGFRPLLSWLGEEISEETLTAVTTKKLSHGQRNIDDRGRLLKLRRRIFWWTFGLKIFDREQLKHH